ncbi:MAG: LamG domain-containing protein [Planctomycetota bacterium]
MHHSLAFPALLSLAFLSACGGAPGPSATSVPSAPGLALELGFEDSCQAVAVTELSVETPPAGIAFGPGVEGLAARFDGSGAALKLRGLDRLGIREAMTLEFFVNAADWKNPYGAGGGLESMVSHSDIFTVAFDPHSWKLQARLTTAASETSLRLSGGTIQPGSWHHVALVMDGALGQARLVLDGEVVDEVAAKGSVAVNSKLDLVVGTWFQKNQAFCGALDSIRIWNRALSLDELRARAASGTPARASSS